MTNSKKAKIVNQISSNSTSKSSSTAKITDDSNQMTEQKQASKQSILSRLWFGFVSILVNIFINTPLEIISTIGDAFLEVWLSITWFFVTTLYIALTPFRILRRIFSHFNDIIRLLASDEKPGKKERMIFTELKQLQSKMSQLEQEMVDLRKKTSKSKLITKVVYEPQPQQPHLSPPSLDNSIESNNPQMPIAAPAPPPPPPPPPPMMFMPPTPLVIKAVAKKAVPETPKNTQTAFALTEKDLEIRFKLRKLSPKSTANKATNMSTPFKQPGLVPSLSDIKGVQLRKAPAFANKENTPQASSQPTNNFAFKLKPVLKLSPTRSPSSSFRKPLSLKLSPKPKISPLAPRTMQATVSATTQIVSNVL